MCQTYLTYFQEGYTVSKLGKTTHVPETAFSRLLKVDKHTASVDIINGRLKEEFDLQPGEKRKNDQNLHIIDITDISHIKNVIYIYIYLIHTYYCFTYHSLEGPERRQKWF